MFIVSRKISVMSGNRIPALFGLACLATSASSTRAEPYVAVDPGRGDQPPIVIPFDPESGAGFDWEAIASDPRLSPNSPEALLRDAVWFLQEGIERMTGTKPAVAVRGDQAKGIVLTTLALAPPKVRADPAIVTALRNDGSDAYNNREAFFLRSETDRLLVVANTVDGLVAAVPALLETVDYEVLAMGPNWIHAPKTERLVFDVELAERPGFYLRQLSPTTGQSYGQGTIGERSKVELSHPSDEFVEESWRRWAIAIRNRGRSMDRFPGHALYRHHRPMLERIRRTGSTEGFLTPATHLGPAVGRPAPEEDNRHHLWICSDPEGTPEFEKVYLSNGKEWEELRPVGLKVNLDITSPVARGIVLEDLKRRAAAHFAENPSEPLVYGTEAEDGAGYAHIGDWTLPRNRDWYPDYLRERGLEWPRPYVLHGYRGIDQEQESYDPAAPADVVFAFNNWLLAEYDRWIDSLPEAERVTASGQSKKDLVRLSLYSYAYHDIPPHLNLDPRIRLMIAGYPKHRGYGAWEAFATAHDVAKAFQVMLPREPSGIYRIYSIAYYADHGLNGLPSKRNFAPAAIRTELREHFDSGILAYNSETDFNFGKFGLGYWLQSRFLWNPDLTAEELDALRNRWLQRAYGSSWRQMKEYYDFMLVENYPANSPAAWARAIRLIDAARRSLDPEKEPEACRRIDDLKVFWYYYYLLDSGKAEPQSPEMLEFAWKGQMSYANAMHMVLKRTWNTRRVGEVVPEAIRRGAAHYTTAETDAWWRRILEHWPIVEVTEFTRTALADGTPAAEVDLNDLVRVNEFETLPTRERPFIYNSAQAPPVSFLTRARKGDEIGFQFSWPAFDDRPPQFYGPKAVPYGIEYWDADRRQWRELVDVTLTTAPSRRVEQTWIEKPRHVVEVRRPAPRTGTYRIEVGRGGFSCYLSGLGYDIRSGQFTYRTPHTFFDRPRGHTQEPVYIYLPKGCRSLDLDVWDSQNRKQVQLFRGISEKGLVPSREVDISERGIHRIALEPGEDGRLARIGGNGFSFPVLYSVPNLWAKSPAELLVPRAIAEADGLTVAE